MERVNLIGTARNARPLRADARRIAAMPGVEFRVRVSGALCHRSGYVLNGSAIDLDFARATSRRLRLNPGAYTLTVFVGAESGRADVDYAVELITGSAVPLHVPGGNPIRARTVDATGFIIIDFTLI